MPAFVGARERLNRVRKGGASALALESKPAWVLTATLR